MPATLRRRRRRCRDMPCHAIYYAARQHDATREALRHDIYAPRA